MQKNKLWKYIIHLFDVSLKRLVSLRKTCQSEKDTFSLKKDLLNLQDLPVCQTNSRLNIIYQRHKAYYGNTALTDKN